MYYYFELNYRKKQHAIIHKNKQFENSLFQHSNQLVFKPWTNSNGVYGSLNWPEKDMDTVVSQYVVDMTKYTRGYDFFVDYWLDHILPTLKDYQ